MYALIKKILFLFPAETAHHLTTSTLVFLRKSGLLRPLISAWIGKPVENPVEVMGLKFRNPAGLAAGFDKDAAYLKEMEILGFGFVEVGTVTPLAQSGNPKPRLFRLPKDEALINRMGFNNKGADQMVGRLKKFRQQFPDSNLIIGGNIGKNKITPNEEAANDYAICYKKLYPYVDYFVVNVSSPNTPNLRELQDKDALAGIFSRIANERKEMENAHRELPARPVLVKIAPDNSPEAVNDILDLVKEFQLAGIVATNTTISRNNLISIEKEVSEIGAGGLSGKPVFNMSTDWVKHIRHRDPEVIIIGVGGIRSGRDAQQKKDAGANLIQVYSGFIFTGPKLIKEAASVQ
ncbi:MAG: quinone-dependent dihydroorotate dehydrogenase [Bacteroidetes bacterium]|nr:quinone-dependent dihydroorotate dehydrogenase [Bacteroidota bacterium]